MKRINVINSSKSVTQLLNESVPSGYIHRKNKSTQIRFNPNVKRFLLNNDLKFTFASNDEETEVYLVAGKDEVEPVRKNSNQTARSFTGLLDLIYHTEGKENYSPLTNHYEIEFKEMDGADYVWNITPVEEIEERDTGATGEHLAAYRASNESSDDEYVNVTENNVNDTTVNEVL